MRGIGYLLGAVVVLTGVVACTAFISSRGSRFRSYNSGCNQECRSPQPQSPLTLLQNPGLIIASYTITDGYSVKVLFR
jgi:hypothetical protein